jgi:hypothetical protein
VESDIPGDSDRLIFQSGLLQPHRWKTRHAPPTAELCRKYEFFLFVFLLLWELFCFVLLWRKKDYTELGLVAAKDLIVISEYFAFPEPSGKSLITVY